MLNYKLYYLIKKLNIVKIINDYVKLEIYGSNYRGFSPFNNERNPSFFVSPNKNIWKDFSSGKGGNIIAFFMKFLNLDYKNAVNLIINKYLNKNKNNNIILLKNNKIKKDNNYYIKKIINLANKYYNNLLKKNKKAINYLNNRGIYKNTIIKFSLGYSSYDSILDYIKKKKIKFNNYILKNTGLFYNINNNFKDLFKNRIMFPIKNINGEIVGFGGRILNDNYKNYKYINSPNNKIYNKSQVLYGLYDAIPYIRYEKFCYIVEGYIDLLSLYEYKIKNVVATLGSSISQTQIDIIKSYTNNILLLYDGDIAGQKAANNNINIFLKNNLNINIFIFPFSKDPNTFLLSKKLTIKNFNLFFIKKSLNFIDFKKKKFKKLLKEPYKKYILIKNILENIKNINNNIIKEFYIQKLANDFKINKYNIYKEINLNYINNSTNKKNIIFKNKYLKSINVLYLYKKYNELLFLFINHFKKYINNYLILNYNNKIIKLNINKIIKNIFFLLKKNKIIFLYKKYNLIIKKIKNKIYLNKKKTKEVNKKINKKINKKNIISMAKEIIYKFKYYYFQNKINLYRKYIKYSNNGKNNKKNLYKIYFLIKLKNKIINKLYYL